MMYIPFLSACVLKRVELHTVKGGIVEALLCYVGRRKWANTPYSCSICIKTSRFSVDFGQKGNELRCFFEILAKNSCYIMN